MDTKDRPEPRLPAVEAIEIDEPRLHEARLLRVEALDPRRARRPQRHADRAPQPGSRPREEAAASVGVPDP